MDLSLELVLLRVPAHGDARLEFGDRRVRQSDVRQDRFIAYQCKDCRRDRVEGDLAAVGRASGGGVGGELAADGRLKSETQRTREDLEGPEEVVLQVVGRLGCEAARQVCVRTRDGHQQESRVATQTGLTRIEHVESAIEEDGSALEGLERDAGGARGQLVPRPASVRPDSEIARERNDTEAKKDGSEPEVADARVEVGCRDSKSALDRPARLEADD